MGEPHPQDGRGSQRYEALGVGLIYFQLASFGALNVDLLSQEHCLPDLLMTQKLVGGVGRLQDSSAKKGKQFVYIMLLHENAANSTLPQFFLLFKPRFIHRWVRSPQIHAQKG